MRRWKIVVMILAWGLQWVGHKVVWLDYGTIGICVIM